MRNLNSNLTLKLLDFFDYNKNELKMMSLFMSFLLSFFLVFTSTSLLKTTYYSTPLIHPVIIYFIFFYPFCTLSVDVAYLSSSLLFIFFVFVPFLSVLFYYFCVQFLAIFLFIFFCHNFIYLNDLLEYKWWIQNYIIYMQVSNDDASESPENLSFYWICEKLH